MDSVDGENKSKISRNVTFGKNVQIGKNVVIKDGCLIGDHVFIDDDAYIDNNVVLRAGVEIGKHSYIGTGCILGEYTANFFKKFNADTKLLKIGSNAVIRSGSIIYENSKIGDYFQTGHHVTIREHSEIGHHVSVGTLSDIQGYCTIGNYVRMHSNVHVGQQSKIEDYVWIFPYVVLTNDPTPPSCVLKGVILKSFSVISTGSIVLPGVVIEGDSLVAAGAVVTKDVHTGEVVAGNPAKVISDISKIKDKDTGENVYPWRYTFKRGMPWEESDYETWRESVME